jgi:hypothetical protein
LGHPTRHCQTLEGGEWQGGIGHPLVLDFNRCGRSSFHSSLSTGARRSPERKKLSTKGRRGKRSRPETLVNLVWPPRPVTLMYNRHHHSGSQGPPYSMALLLPAAYYHPHPCHCCCFHHPHQISTWRLRLSSQHCQRRRKAIGHTRCPSLFSRHWSSIQRGTRSKFGPTSTRNAQKNGREI